MGPERHRGLWRVHTGTVVMHVLWTWCLNPNVNAAFPSPADGLSLYRSQTLADTCWFELCGSTDTASRFLLNALKPETLWLRCALIFPVYCVLQLTFEHVYNLSVKCGLVWSHRLVCSQGNVFVMFLKKDLMFMLLPSVNRPEPPHCTGDVSHRSYGHWCHRYQWVWLGPVLELWWSHDDVQSQTNHVLSHYADFPSYTLYKVCCILFCVPNLIQAGLAIGQSA